MILIFDLDDTLYEEITFVYSGFFAVSKYIHKEYGFDKTNSFNLMKNYLKIYGRGKVFDKFLKSKKIFSRKLVRKCISTYRLHKPNIKLTREAEYLLKMNKANVYLVTDGNKVVQKNKIEALSLNKYFKKIFITHRYGIKNSKPSSYCFDLIRKMEKCKWEDLIYVGDNPAKDFVNLNKLNVTTIRVLTGEYRNVTSKKGYDAKLKIKNLSEIEKLMITILKKKEEERN